MMSNRNDAGKMLKLCRSYLHHIQNSVFEGEITEARLEELKIKGKENNERRGDKDSLIIFKSRNEKWLEKEIVGTEKDRWTMCCDSG